ncbi:MAG TPA: DoxX family protein [Myxococcota bacterium]|nr:DoxX family protein [Myxococcota bacterium]
MQQENRLSAWLRRNRAMAIEILRIYLGIALLVKGVQFVMNPEQAVEYANMVRFPFFEFLSMHLVAVLHIAGGFLLAIGLITRIAALIQIPILFGAVFFVHFQQGLFSKSQDLEYVILVFFLLLVFVVYGGGRLSVDYVIEQRNRRSKSAS